MTFNLALNVAAGRKTLALEKGRTHALASPDSSVT